MNGAEDIWSQRARQHGRRGAVNLRITDEELDDETRRVESIVFPVLGREIHGSPEWMLDYGCGWGRFTADVAHFTQAAHAIGYDPCAELVALAVPPGDIDVRFVTCAPREFFSSLEVRFDFIWIHGVLGGIGDGDLPEVAQALCGALAPQGMLFFVEDTAPLDPHNTFWRTREQQHYIDVFSKAGLRLKIAGLEPTRFGGIKTVFAARKFS